MEGEGQEREGEGQEGWRVTRREGHAGMFGELSFPVWP